MRLGKQGQTLERSSSDKHADSKVKRLRPGRDIDYTDWTAERIQKEVSNILTEACSLGSEFQTQVAQAESDFEAQIAQMEGDFEAQVAQMEANLVTRFAQLVEEQCKLVDRLRDRGIIVVS